MTHQFPAISGVFFPCAYFAITNIVSVCIYIYIYIFYARPHSRENVFAVSVPRFVCPSEPHVSARLQLDGFSWNLILGTFKNLSRNSKFITIWHKYRTHEDLSVFHILPVTTVSQIKISDFSGEMFKGFKVLHISMTATTTQLLSSG